MIEQDWSSDLTTRTEFRFHVRPVRPQDEQALADFFTHVTQDDLRFRFLTGINEVGHDRLAAMTAVDHRQKENFLAFTDDGETLIASAMLACDAELETGEVAIVIRSDYKRHGVSWELLEHVARYAEAKGVKILESIESRDNHAAIELEREMGFTAKSCPDDPTLIHLRRTLVLA